MIDQEIAESLANLLADTFVLQLHCYNFHWNVTGINFKFLHEEFQRQYEELGAAVDVIAEQIRQLNFFAPGTMQSLMKRTSIQEPIPEFKFRDCHVMMEHLLLGHTLVQQTILKCIYALPQESFAAEAVTNLLADRQAAHGKHIWFLKSLLQNDFEGHVLESSTVSNFKRALNFSPSQMNKTIDNVLLPQEKNTNLNSEINSLMHLSPAEIHKKYEQESKTPDGLKRLESLFDELYAQFGSQIKSSSVKTSSVLVGIGAALGLLAVNILYDVLKSAYEKIHTEPSNYKEPFSEEPSPRENLLKNLTPEELQIYNYTHQGIK